MSQNHHKITSKLTEDSHKKSARRCDQCYNKHLLCDKSVPVCNQCRKNNLDCTRKRKYKYSAVSKYEKVEDYFLNGRILPLKEINKKNTCNSEFQLALNKEVSFVNSTPQFFRKKLILSSPVKSFKDNDCKTTLKNMVSLNSWLDFFYIAKILGVSVYNSHSDKFIVVKYIHKVKSLIPPSKEDSQITLSISNLLEDLNLSIEAYFHYVNPFFPLFSFEQFVSKTRSRFLKSCIQRIGLQFLPKTKQRNELSSYLDKLLQNQVKPSKLTPCIDSSQALLVLIYGALSPVLLKHRRSLYHILVSWTHLLGLEFFKKHKKLTEIQTIAYSVHGLDYLFSFDYDIFFLKPLPFPTFQSLNSMNPVSWCYRLNSSILKASFYYLKQPFINLEVISQILIRYDSETVKLLSFLSSGNSQKYLIDVVFIKLQYHFTYLTILDLVFKLETQKLTYLDCQLLQIFKQSGYFHSVSIVRYLITISNGPFVIMRKFMLLTVSRILNSWAFPQSDSLYLIIKRILIRTNVEYIRYYYTNGLSLLDQLFFGSSSLDR